MSVTLTEAEREALRRRLANWSKSDGRVGAMLQRDVVPEVEAIVTERLESMTREARLSREATGKAVASRIARHELERALRAADAPEDSMATDDDLMRYEGRAEAVEIMRDMLGLEHPASGSVYIQGHLHAEPICAWPDCSTYLTPAQMEARRA